MQKETVRNVFHQTKGLGETWPELRRKGPPKYCFPPRWLQFPLPDPWFFLTHAQNVHLDTRMLTPRSRCAQLPWSPARKREKKNPLAQHRELSGSMRSTKQTRDKQHPAPKRVADVTVGFVFCFRSCCFTKLPDGYVNAWPDALEGGNTSLHQISRLEILFC